MGNAEYMGLISRVSSRTYRNLIQKSTTMFTTVVRRNAAQKALNTTFINPHMKALGFAKQTWSNHSKHIKAEMTPPGPGELVGGATALIGNTVAFASGGFLNMTVKELFVTSLVAAEVGVWFCLGEIIGKRKLIGYDTRPLGQQWDTKLFGLIPLPSFITGCE